MRMYSTSWGTISSSHFPPTKVSILLASMEGPRWSQCPDSTPPRHVGIFLRRGAGVSRTGTGDPAIGRANALGETVSTGGTGRRGTESTSYTEFENDIDQDHHHLAAAVARARRRRAGSGADQHQYRRRGHDRPRPGQRRPGQGRGDRRVQEEAWRLQERGAAGDGQGHRPEDGREEPRPGHVRW